jgi:hypothetical protein
MQRDTIIGERLTSWAVAEGGEHVRLGFEDEAGQPCAVALPIAVLSALMMTIPRMLQQALEARFADGSLRMIHELGEWRVERAVGVDASILSLTTPDGFEVTFAVATPQADRLGQTLRHSASPSAAVRAPAVN